jgi:hypothetical protein
MILIKKLLIIGAVLIFVGCDKNFKEINTDPFATTDINPGFLFAGSQRVGLGGWETEHTIAQQFVNPFNLGATTGPNFNEDIDNFNNGTWNNYTGAVKNYTQALALLEGNKNRENLKSMIRIWKAFVFMMIVDTYGDVPYFEAGKAYLEGKFYPKYDDDAAIYADLEKELRESIAALNPNGDFVSEDLFFGAHGSVPSGNAATQIPKWKKLGNSILLRLGMRYSKVNPTKAAAIVAEAFNGGVMTSNADNAYVTYDGTIFTNGANNGLFDNNPYYYYAAEPFVNQLKSTNDPRTPCLVARFADPAKPFSSTANTVIADQYGVPVGVTSTALNSAPYRGKNGSGYDYSQMNVNCIASRTAPTFWVTYAQTSLLLAEAAHRGWIPGGDAQAKTYYENGIIADMDNYAKFGGTISGAEKAAYLADPLVAYDPANALKQINIQYWIATIRNGAEAWANLRRSGFALIGLTPNLYNNNLNGGFIRRLSYPDYEASNNAANYNAAVQAIGGKDDLVTPVFWDK